MVFGFQVLITQLLYYTKYTLCFGGAGVGVGLMPKIAKVLDFVHFVTVSLKHKEAYLLCNICVGLGLLNSMHLQIC